MTATLPPSAAHNRIAQHLPSASLLPTTPEARRQAWADALFAAAMFYQSRLAHPNVAIAENAARAIFDLEKTRLRHDRDLAGTTSPVEPAAVELPAAPTKPAEDEGLLLQECDGIISDYLDRTQPLPKPAVKEMELFAKFQGTPQYAKLVTAFKQLYREDRDIDLPDRGADSFAQIYFLNRYRESPGGELESIVHRR